MNGTAENACELTLHNGVTIPTLAFGCAFGPDAPFVRSWPTGGMVLMVAAMLGLSLVLHYF